jgi:hypothetical protein
VSQNLTFARKMEPLLQRLGGERIEAQPLRQRVVPGHELLGPDPLLPIALVAMAIEKGIGRPAGTDAVLVPRAAPSVPPQCFSKVVCTNCMSEIQEPRYFVIDSAPYCLACAEPHLRRERGPIGKILHWSRELLIASFGGLLVVLMLLQISIVWMAPLAAAVVWTITRPPRRHEIHEVDRAATAGASRSP